MGLFTDSEKVIFNNLNFIYKIKFVFGRIKSRIIEFFYRLIPFLRPIYYTRNNMMAITFKMWFYQKVLGFNRSAYFPVHFTSSITGYKNIYVGVGTSAGSSNGCYIQAVGKVYIDDYTTLAPNVGIISSNHVMSDFRKHQTGDVKIGKYCWIGMNAVILPNVTLGDFTIVGAGSVVTKSFPDGYCVVGGNPAKVIKTFPEESRHEFVRYEHEYKYNGYIPAEKFDSYRKKHLLI